jgi:hypothetical protein
MRQPALAIAAAVIALGAIAIPGRASVSLLPACSSGGDFINHPPPYDPPDTTCLVPDTHHFDPHDGMWYWVSAAPAFCLDDWFSTIAGHEYRLSFLVEATKDDPTTRMTGVIVDGATMAPGSLSRHSVSFSSGDGVSPTSWMAESLVFTAVSRETVVTFQANGIINPNSVPLLRDVSVSDITPTPEPATIVVWLLLGSASWLATRVHRARRRSGRRRN